jgi:hypothetical protein
MDRDYPCRLFSNRVGDVGDFRRQSLDEIGAGNGQ